MTARSPPNARKTTTRSGDRASCYPETIFFTYLTMNSKQAKAEPLHEFLGRMGYQPAHVRGNDIWYRSPFRPWSAPRPSRSTVRKTCGSTMGLVLAEPSSTSCSTWTPRRIFRVLGTIADVLGNAPRPTIVLPDAPERPRDRPSSNRLGRLRMPRLRRMCVPGRFRLI